MKKHISCGNPPSREIASLRSQRHISLPPSGEVARSADRGFCAQYDVKIKSVAEMRTIFHPFGFCGGADNENLPFPASGSPSARFPQKRKCGRFFCESKKIRPFRCPRKRKKASRSLSSGGFVVGAGNENRTRNRSLGSSYFTTKLCPHISGCISHATLLLYFTIFAVILQAFWRRF